MALRAPSVQFQYKKDLLRKYKLAYTFYSKALPHSMKYPVHMECPHIHKQLDEKHLAVGYEYLRNT